MENLVDFDEKRMNDVMSQKLEVRMGKQVADIILATGKKIVYADDIRSLFNIIFAEMTSQESGTTCDEDTTHFFSFFGCAIE